MIIIDILLGILALILIVLCIFVVLCGLFYIVVSGLIIVGVKYEKYKAMRKNNLI